MQKFLLFILLGCFSLPVLAQDKFAESLRSCSPYSESNTNEVFGMTVTSSLKVLGRSGNLCGLNTSITTPSGSVDVSCNLTDAQIEEMVTAMEENASEIEAVSKQNADAASQLAGNPALSVLNKYLTDPTVCTVNQ